MKEQITLLINSFFGIKDQIILLAASFGVTLVAGLLVEPVLKKIGAVQHVRDDGPETHAKKEGVLTMGGIIFLISAAFLIILSAINQHMLAPQLIVLLISMLAFGFIGAIDDYIKVSEKRSLGLAAWQKVILLLLVSGAVVFLILEVLKVGTSTYIPFVKQFYDLGYYFFIPFAILVLMSTTNVVNITDGLDGLATGIVIIIMTFFTMYGIAMDDKAIITFSVIMTGTCLGFLTYNMNPAKIFMGDVGSLALGGAIGTISLITETPLLLIVVAGVCVAEALSDIIQVVYFKFSKGKRIFKMAPLHHHLELSGWSERKIVWNFWIITVVLCVIGFWLL